MYTVLALVLLSIILKTGSLTFIDEASEWTDKKNADIKLKYFTTFLKTHEDL
jgi:hypothetical protein